MSGWRPGPFRVVVGLVALSLSLVSGCGRGERLHAETDFPLAPGARVVAHDEGRTDFGPQFQTNLIVLGDRSTSAQKLVREERELVRREGWKRHVLRHSCFNRNCHPLRHPYVNWYGPPSDYVTFGPLFGPKRHQAGGFDRGLAQGSPGPLRRKIYVDIEPPEPQPYP